MQRSEHDYSIRNVTVVTVSDILEQDYEHLHIYKNNLHTPKTFNLAIKNVQSVDAFLFMGPDSNFLNAHVVSTLVEILNAHSGFAGIMTDVICQHRAYIPVREWESRIVNVPLMIKKDVIENFREDLQTLYLYDMLVRLSRKCLIYQYPAPLMILPYHYKLDVGQDDFKKIYNESSL